MQLEQLQQWIKENLYTKDNRINAARLRPDYDFVKNNQVYINDILIHTSFLNKNTPLPQRIYHIQNNILAKQYCIKCNIKETTFISFREGYKKYCYECGKRICGDFKKGQTSKKKTQETQIKNILNCSNGIYTLNETKYILKNNISDTHNWFNKNLINNVKLLNSVIYHTKFISYDKYKIENFNDFNFSERIYCILNNIITSPICIYCNKNYLPFINFIKGYQNSCSKQCSFKYSNKTRIKTTENKIKTRLKEINCELKEKFIGIKNPINVMCKTCNKTFKYNFPCGSYIRNTLCPFCYVNSSKPEREISQFIEGILGKEFIKNRFRIYDNGVDNSLSYTELDIYLPKHNLAIEFNGLYWHSEENGKDKKYHLNKTKLCEDKGIQLLHIFENEWIYKQDIVKSIILSKVGIFSERYYARKCCIKEVDSKSKNNFLQENHLQGTDKSSVKLGLFYENKLLSVMTFGRRKITGGKSKFELIRYCNKLNIQVVGGASKLFQHFLNNYDYNEIVTYADRRYSNSSFYEKIGFELDHISKPNYWYFRLSELNLRHRVNFQKHKLKDKLELFDPKLTEYENMLNNGYSRIWDCGNFVYKYK